MCSGEGTSTLVEGEWNCCCCARWESGIFVSDRYGVIEEERRLVLVSRRCEFAVGVS